MKKHELPFESRTDTGLSNSSDFRSTWRINYFPHPDARILEIDAHTRRIEFAYYLNDPRLLNRVRF